jgi:hypothetical protein
VRRRPQEYRRWTDGEADSSYARDAFNHFIPIGAETKARVQIIRDFFEVIAAVAAHGKTNGLSAYKLSRYVGWWAFNHIDTGKGFDAGYKSWESAADAATHLFFAYLRSVAPKGKTSGVLSLPRSLQQLLESTQYPPGRGFISNDTTKLVMIVDVVSPTPYALLRRAKNFEYRDSDHALQEFSSFEDPVKALTDECRRVLSAISSTNESQVSNAKTSTSLSDPSWSRFEDIGFGSTLDEVDEHSGFLNTRPTRHVNGTQSAMDLARPTTPSWADFLSSGFDENGNRSGAPVLLPPDKVLPPINASMRGQSSQSHRRNLEPMELDPGELASISSVHIDDAFWWVWISSLAVEEPQSRKAVFGRCALIETIFTDGRWMVMEEQVKGAAPEPPSGAFVTEKKRSFLGFTTKGGRLTRRRSGIKKSPLIPETNGNQRPNIAPDQQDRIQQKAAELSRKKAAEEAAVRKRELPSQVPASNRNSTFTLGPNKEEFSPALAWAKKYDKETIRAQYLGDKLAGKGSRELLTLPSEGLNRSMSSISRQDTKELPPAPAEQTPEQEWPSPAPAQMETPTIVEPAPMPPEPTRPADPIPEEVREAPLPAASPLATPIRESPPNKLRKSQDGGRRSPEEKRNRKMGPPPVQKQTGIRRLFGTKRSKSKEADVPKQATREPEITDPAILAAQAALEGKPGLAPGGTDSPPLSPSFFNKMKTVNPTKPDPTIEQPRAPTPPTEPVTEPDSPIPGAFPETPANDLDTYMGPPRTRRDDEYDQLSRVDTNEREDADKEFSKFDQGPLDDQPAFVPDDSPVREQFPPAEIKRKPQHQSAYSAVTIPVEESDEDEDDAPPAISATDRWAQIRKNAAERARQSEEQTSRSRTETRTDDGETSGEESE